MTLDRQREGVCFDLPHTPTTPCERGLRPGLAVQRIIWINRVLSNNSAPASPECGTDETVVRYCTVLYCTVPEKHLQSPLFRAKQSPGSRPLVPLTLFVFAPSACRSVPQKPLPLSKDPWRLPTQVPNPYTSRAWC